MGKRREDMIEDMIELLDLPMTTEELNEEYANLVEPMYAQCKMLEGAARLIRHLKAHDIPIGRLSSKFRRKKRVIGVILKGEFSSLGEFIFFVIQTVSVPGNRSIKKYVRFLIFAMCHAHGCPQSGRRTLCS